MRKGRPGGHREGHRTGRIQWLRAAVLGANDGIVSTSSLLVGVAAAGASQSAVVTAGMAGLVAGAMSMAAGEYVSVSSQTDTEEAELERERWELATDLEFEHAELAAIYEKRGLEAELAATVATQLMQHDALGAHARDELGITETLRPNPVQAAVASGATFALGASLPLLTAALVPKVSMVSAVALGSLAFLMMLGVASARLGGASLKRGAFRVTFWGVLALVITYLVGSWFGTRGA